jgi:hypothetical protein
LKTLRAGLVGQRRANGNALQKTSANTRPVCVVITSPRRALLQFFHPTPIHSPRSVACARLSRMRAYNAFSLLIFLGIVMLVFTRSKSSENCMDIGFAMISLANVWETSFCPLVVGAL